MGGAEDGCVEVRPRELPTAGPLGRMRDLAAFRTFEAQRVASLD